MKWWFIGIAAIAILGWVIHEGKQTAPQTINYNASKICDDTFEKNYDFRADTEHNHFDITLREGCFDAFVMLPKSWHSWDMQPTGDETGFWIAFWHENRQSPLGPYVANQTFNFAYMTTVFRLQGHGTARFFTNQVEQPKPRHVEPIPSKLPDTVTP